MTKDEISGLINTRRFGIQVGPHRVGLKGWWAIINEGRVLKGGDNGAWENYGHGFTVKQAIDEAFKIYLNKQTKSKRTSRDFECNPLN